MKFTDEEKRGDESNLLKVTYGSVGGRVAFQHAHFLNLHPVFPLPLILKSKQSKSRVLLSLADSRMLPFKQKRNELPLCLATVTPLKKY